MDNVRSGCRSPGAGVGLRQHDSHQGGLNRSYSSTGGGTQWPFGDSTNISDWNTADDSADDNGSNRHRLMAKALNTNNEG